MIYLCTLRAHPKTVEWFAERGLGEDACRRAACAFGRRNAGLLCRFQFVDEVADLLVRVFKLSEFFAFGFDYFGFGTFNEVGV